MPKYRFSNIKKIILIASGKGGVGKSTIAVNLAVQLAKRYNVGVLDADVYGPSISRLMGTVKKPDLNEKNYFVPIEAHNLKFISSECFVSDEKNSSFIWRGPMIVKMLYRMMCNTVWGGIDYLIVDTPPGTGDIHISLCENFELDGVILCSTPQMLSIDDVKKSGNMFVKMGVNIIGIIENMSSFVYGRDVNYIFGNSNIELLTSKFSVPLLAKIPLITEISTLSDVGIPVVVKNERVASIFESIVVFMSSIKAFNENH